MLKLQICAITVIMINMNKIQCFFDGSRIKYINDLGKSLEELLLLISESDDFIKEVMFNIKGIFKIENSIKEIFNKIQKKELIKEFILKKEEQIKDIEYTKDNNGNDYYDILLQKKRYRNDNESVITTRYSSEDSLINNNVNNTLKHSEIKMKTLDNYFTITEVKKKSTNYKTDHSFKNIKQKIENNKPLISLVSSPSTMSKSNTSFKVCSPFCFQNNKKVFSLSSNVLSPNITFESTKYSPIPSTKSFSTNYDIQQISSFSTSPKFFSNSKIIPNFNKSSDIGDIKTSLLSHNENNNTNIIHTNDSNISSFRGINSRLEQFKTFTKIHSHRKKKDKNNKKGSKSLVERYLEKNRDFISNNKCGKNNSYKIQNKAKSIDINFFYCNFNENINCNHKNLSEQKQSKGEVILAEKTPEKKNNIEKFDINKIIKNETNKEISTKKNLMYLLSQHIK